MPDVPKTSICTIMKKSWIGLLLVLPLFSACKKKSTEIETVEHRIGWLTGLEGIQAGAILVPENHAAPEGNKITITYAIIKARDTTSSHYPVVFFSGGPGGKSIDEGMTEYIMQDPLGEDRDIILFDQRGIGYSSALPDMSLAAFDIMVADADEDEELALTRKMIGEYKIKCEEAGINTEFYNTLQNAQDVGLLFEHLGYDKYNLLGGSYGTRIARMVQDLFPEYIHSSVLDSPSPLSGDFLIDRFESYSLALSRIFEYCEQDPDCGQQYPDLRNDYYKAFDTLSEQPLQVNFNDTTTVHINAQDGIYLLRRLLYQPDARQTAPQLIREFNNGGGPLVERVLKFKYELSNALNLSMLLSVERFEQFNPLNTPDEIEKQYQKYPLLPVRLGFFDAFYQAGKSWHDASMPLDERKFKESDVPTLIFVNQYDPVTPPINGRLFMETLNNGHLLILDEGGHGGGNQECKDSVINAFISDPAKELDISCLNLYKMPE